MIRLAWLRDVFALFAAVFVATLLGGQCNAGILINEITLNSENSGGSGSDDGKEFIELISDTGGVEAMSGLTLLIIDGDGSSAGVIDKALDVSSFSTGANGLFLWRDSNTVLSPAPDAATTLHVEDLNPDIENGSATFALVSGFSGSVGDDLDTDNDGTIDVALPWASVADAVGVMEGGGADDVYAAAIGGVNLANANYDPDSIVRLSDTGEWIAIDINEAASEFPGPYTFDDLQAQRADGTPFTPSAELTFNILTPGGANPANVIPEPAGLTLLGLAGLALMGARGGGQRN